jgi:hypothetical protein
MLMCLSSLTFSIDKLVKTNQTSIKIKKQKIKPKTINHFNLPIDLIEQKQIKNIKTPIQSIRDVVTENLIFNKLEDVKKYQLKLFNQNKHNPEMVLVSFDVNLKYSKNWCLFSTRQDLYNFIKQNKNYPLYEQINTEYHKLFFDIDINKGDKGFNEFNFYNYKEQIEKELHNVLLNDKLNFVWLDSSSDIKHSFHLIVKNIVCNIYQNQQIKDYLNKQLKSYFLDEVYSKKRCFRMWNCSKFGENRPLKPIGKTSFCSTLVNIYGKENVEKINTKIDLKKEKVEQNFLNNTDWISIPNNEYLRNNFVQNKYKSSVYNRKHKNISLPCPICTSPKDLCKEKHHKNTDVYIFNKNEKTYMGCFRAKQWMGERFFLNLDTNIVEYAPKNDKNNISPNIVSAGENYNMKKNEFPTLRIAKILYDKITFGKYKNRQVKELFSDVSYVNWIMNTPSFDSWKIKKQLKELIEYYRTIPLQPQPSTPTIQTKQTKYEMIVKLVTKWGIDIKYIEKLRLDEIKMHYDTMKRHGCFG